MAETGMATLALTQHRGLFTRPTIVLLFPFLYYVNNDGQWGFVIVDTVCTLPITYKSWNVGVGTFYTAATNQTRATSINPTLNTVKLVANYTEGPANGYYLCIGK